MAYVDTSNHLCLICNQTVVGLLNYVEHFKTHATPQNGHIVEQNYNPSGVKGVLGAGSRSDHADGCSKNVCSNQQQQSNQNVQESGTYSGDTSPMSEFIDNADDFNDPDLGTDGLLSPKHCPDFFQSLELKSANEDAPPRPKIKAVERLSVLEDDVHAESLLPITSILSNLEFSSDEEFIGVSENEEEAGNSDNFWLSEEDEEQASRHPPQGHTGGKWRPGEGPKRRLPIAGKWKPGHGPGPACRQNILKKPAKSSENKNDAGKRFYCNVCLSYFVGRNAYSLHFSQPQHKEIAEVKKQKTTDYLEEADLLKDESTACPQNEHEAPSGETSQGTPRRGNDICYCPVCDLYFDSAVVFSTHCETKLHKDALLKRGFREYKGSDGTVFRIDIHNDTIIKGKQENIWPAVDSCKLSRITDKIKKGPEDHNCHICQKHFTRKYEMARHLLTRMHHTRSQKHLEAESVEMLNKYNKYMIRLSPFQCGLCQFYFNRQRDFLDHMGSSSHVTTCKDMLGAIMCVACKYKTHRHSEMMVHLQYPEHLAAVEKRHGICIVRESHNRIMCKFCGVRMHSAVRMKRHCHKRHADRLSEVQVTMDVKIVDYHMYNCPLCEKAYRAKSLLQLHFLKVHKNTSLFNCSECNRGFLDQRRLDNHLRTRFHAKCVALNKLREAEMGTLKKTASLDEGSPRKDVNVKVPAPEPKHRPLIPEANKDTKLETTISPRRSARKRKRIEFFDDEEPEKDDVNKKVKGGTDVISSPGKMNKRSRSRGRPIKASAQKAIYTKIVDKSHSLKTKIKPVIDNQNNFKVNGVGSRGRIKTTARKRNTSTLKLNNTTSSIADKIAAYSNSRNKSEDDEDDTAIDEDVNCCPSEAEAESGKKDDSSPSEDESGKTDDICGPGKDESGKQNDGCSHSEDESGKQPDNCCKDEYDESEKKNDRSSQSEDEDDESGKKIDGCSLSEDESGKKTDVELDEEAINEAGKHIFSCAYCELAATDLMELRRHYNDNHPNDILACQPCNQYFLSLKAYKIHCSGRGHQLKLREQSGKTTMHKCKMCDKHFLQESCCLLHMETLHRHPSCEADIQRILKGQDLVTQLYGDHIKQVGILCNDISVSCPECGKFVRKDSLVEHLRLHTGERPYICRFCSKGFAGRLTLRRHISSHLNMPMFMCDLCGKEFMRHIHLIKHIRQHDSEKKGEKHKCRVCKAWFYTAEELTRHMRRHGDRNYKCTWPGCHWTFVLSGELKSHMFTHTGEKKYLCDTCGFGAPTKTRLRRHVKTHDRTRNFACDYCPYKATCKTHLKRHMRIHINARPFACPYCNYTCNTHENIRKHILKTLKHKGLKLYPCKLCNSFGCDSSKDFRAHLMTVHANYLRENAVDSLAVFSGLYKREEDFQKPQEGSEIIQVTKGRFFRSYQNLNASVEPVKPKKVAKKVNKMEEVRVIIVPPSELKPDEGINHRHQEQFHKQELQHQAEQQLVTPQQMYLHHNMQQQQHDEEDEEESLEAVDSAGIAPQYIGVPNMVIHSYEPQQLSGATVSFSSSAMQHPNLQQPQSLPMTVTVSNDNVYWTVIPDQRAEPTSTSAATPEPWYSGMPQVHAPTSEELQQYRPVEVRTSHTGQFLPSSYFCNIPVGDIQSIPNTVTGPIYTSVVENVVLLSDLPKSDAS